MDILVTQNHMDSVGGTETFTYTMVRELYRQGHNVDLFTLRPGILSKLLEGICSVNKLKDSYDLVLANHITTIKELPSKLKSKSPIIQTIHGTIPPEEAPSYEVNHHVSISQEIQASLPVKSKVIHNGIDCDYFRPDSSINPRPKHIYSLAQSNEANMLILQAAKILGCSFASNNKNTNYITDTVREINKADIVFGLGRSAYEGMACGRAVFVFDARHYMGNKGDGMIVPENISSFIYNNCSGRYSNKRYTAEMIAAEIDRTYSESLGESNRKTAVSSLNMAVNVNKYIDMIFNH